MPLVVLLGILAASPCPQAGRGEPCVERDWHEEPPPASLWTGRHGEVSFSLGLPDFLGLRVAFAPIPVLAIEAQLGTILLAQSLSLSVRLRPLAGSHPVTPVLGFGAGGFVLPDSRWEFHAMLLATLGVETCTDSGLVFGLDLVGMLGGLGRTRGWLLPGVTVRVGYAF